MNNNQKLFKMMSVAEYDISIRALAVLLKIPQSTFNKILNTRKITDSELKRISNILETGEWELVFKVEDVKCQKCDNYFKKTHHSQKYCSEECKNIVKIKNLAENNKTAKIKITPRLPYGKSQKLLTKEVIKATKNGTTYGEVKKQRDLEYYESQFVKYADRKVDKV